MSDAIYIFGEFELDTTLFELRKSGSKIAMEPRVFDVLAHLVTNRDRVVPQQELIDKLWGGAVSATALPRCIKEARKLLGDTPSEQSFVQTLRGRGYRFVAEVRGATAQPRAASTVAAQPPADGLVGRSDVMSELLGAFDDADAGRGTIALLGGQAGIGKTRILSELTRAAGARGAAVLGGRCFEGEGAPAYWPWTQIFRTLAKRREPPNLSHEHTLWVAGTAQSLPEVSGQQAPSPERRRFRLFDEVARFLRRSGKVRTIVLTLDDLHWADEASLRVLEFLSQNIDSSRLLIIGAYRDLAMPERLARTVKELARNPAVRRISLGGLGTDDVAELMQRVWGQAAKSELVQQVHAMTEGNPFFVDEVLRRLPGPDLDGGRIPIPAGVRDAIEHRLESLPEQCRNLLDAVSVLSDQFTPALAARLTETPVDDALEHLDRSVREGWIREARPERFELAHALVRETLYEALTAKHRAEWHRAAAEILSQRATDDPEMLGVIAHHFMRAAGSGAAEQAVDFSLRAARHAEARLAYEQAARHYDDALEAMDRGLVGTSEQRAEIQRDRDSLREGR